jgi:hypothetical protein
MMALVRALAKVSIELKQFIIIKPNYFQNAQKGECFLDDFEALVRERRFRALVRQNDLRPHTTMPSRNVILKVKKYYTILAAYNRFRVRRLQTSYRNILFCFRKFD